MSDYTVVIAYIEVAACIAANLVSCSLLTASDGFTKPLQSWAGIFLALFNYFLLARAILFINYSIAYAIWVGLGIIVSSLISVFYFKQHLSRTGVFCIGLIGFGLVFIHLFGTM